MGNQTLKQHVETSKKTGVFNMTKSKLSEFPPALVALLEVLRSLDLSDNRMTSIPQNIGAFINLKNLNLSSNLIEVIPDQVGQLSKLESLNLSSNRIRSVPQTLQNLSKLRELNLSSNNISAFPAFLSKLKFLNVLDLGNNSITAVPDGVEGLSVIELILLKNKITRVSPALAKCPNLKTLRLQDNSIQLEGFPAEILSDSPVSLLNIEGNAFEVKKLEELHGYEQYMERYTATKKKLN
jgi:Leucine-rich repeat (LRR) protein